MELEQLIKLFDEEITSKKRLYLTTEMAEALIQKAGYKDVFNIEELLNSGKITHAYKEFDHWRIPVSEQGKKAFNEMMHGNSNRNHKNPISKDFKYVLVFSLIVIVVSVFAIKSCGGETGSGNSDVVSNSAYDASVHQVERYLKKEYLKDPDSYESMEWSKVQKEDNNSIYKYFVRHKYRARNSYGGYVIEEKIFYLDQEGNVVNVTDY